MAQPERVTPEHRLAERLDAGPSGWRKSLARALRDVGEVDRSIYRAVATTPTPSLDAPIRRLSRTADHSKLWLAIAAGLVLVGGPKGRRAAATGVVAIGVTSAMVNLPMKLAGRRARPDPDAIQVPSARRVDVPTSSSFPSGHAASAAAFTNAVGDVLPSLGAPLRLLASAVGVSRVHTGVHYPSDVIVGAVVGETVGEAVAWIGRRISGSSEGRHAGELSVGPGR